MSEIVRLKKDIRFKELCIQHTDKWIKNPATDAISKMMIEQSFRLESELDQLKAKLAELTPKKKKKTTRRR